MTRSNQSLGQTHNLAAPRFCRRRLRFLVTALLLLHLTPGLADPAGTALVIGEAGYAGQPMLPRCGRSAQAVAARLRRLGFTVEQAIDAPTVTLQSTLEDFAYRSAAAPEIPTLVYVCAEAIATDSRLFLMPSDVNPQKVQRPQTQGIVARALFNAIAGTNGSLIIELGVPAGTNAAPAVSSLREGRPASLHLALTVGADEQVGALGERLASDDTEIGQGWDRLVPALQAGGHGPPPAIAVYAPPPAPFVPPSASSVPAQPPPGPPPSGSPDRSQTPAGNAAARDGAQPSGPPPAPITTVPEVALPPPTGPEVAPPPQPGAGGTGAAPPEASTAAAPPPVTPPSRPGVASSIAAPPAPEHPPARNGSSASRAAQSGTKTVRPAAAANGRDGRIRRLQILLSRRGIYSGPLNGVADDRTTRAIRAYQSVIGDPMTGTITESEVVRLLNNR
jgi:hypothetical protein